MSARKDVTGTSARSESRAATILICEDDPALRELLRVTLEGDFVFAETADGRAAVELAQKLRPDVVLLDVMLPGLNGLDVLSQIRADPELRDTRVVVMTAFSEVEHRDAEEAGADGFLSKPFDPLELTAIVEELLARRR